MTNGRTKITLTPDECDLLQGIIAKYDACCTWGACAPFDGVWGDDLLWLMEKLEMVKTGV